MHGKNHGKSLLLLVGIILVYGICQLLVFFVAHADQPASLYTPDSAAYDQAARAILKTGHFALGPDTPEIPQTDRTPGYPLLIAAMFFLFGEDYTPLIMAQIGLSLATIVVTYWLATTLWEPKVGVLSALFLACDLPSFAMSQKIMTETLFTFILSVAIITGLYALQDSHHAGFWMFLHITLLSVVTLIRPIAYYIFLPVIMTVIVLWKIMFSWPWKKILALALLSVIPWIGLVGGWQVRNYLVTERANFTSKQWEHLLFHFGAHLIAQRDQISFKEARYQRLGYGRYTELHPETAGWSTAQLGEKWKHDALELIRQHPWLFLKVWVLRGVLTMLIDPGEHDFRVYVGEDTGPGRDFFELPFDVFIRKWVWGKAGFFVLYGFITSYIIVLYVSLLFSGWQTIRTCKRSSSISGLNGGTWRAHILIGMFLFYFVIVSAGVDSRFRIPMMPLFCLYAGHGMYSLAMRINRSSASQAQPTVT
jgi:4-amino-4-deoxy-L-arabinose transferase-like glycosyltransferase